MRIGGIGGMGGMAGIAALTLAAAAMTGCRVDTRRDGDSKDVKIETPFGGMQVKTRGEVVGIGLPVYPGAQAVKEDNDDGAADVNMSFGSFQLRVKAATYRTNDTPAKVEAFYRNGLKRFGDVVACQNDKPVGTPAQTAEGLTCDSDKQGKVQAMSDTGMDKMELKAGSKQHQHIVAIEPEHGGTKFSLVALDLPGKLFSDGDGAGRQ